jgi:hypothetical protein
MNDVHCMQEMKIVFEEKFHYFKMRSIKCREIFSAVVGRALKFVSTLRLFCDIR